MAQSRDVELLRTLLGCFPDELVGQIEAQRVSVDDLRRVCSLVLNVFEKLAEGTAHMSPSEQKKLAFLQYVLGTATQYLNDFTSEVPLWRTAIIERKKISTLANRLADVTVGARVLSDSMGRAVDEMQHHLGRIQSEVDEIQHRLHHIADE